MKDKHFRFHRPRTLDEAQAHLLASPAAVVLAGGQHLVPRWRETGQPDTIVSLSGISALALIGVEDNVLSIGASATLHEVASSRLVRMHLPALASLASWMGDGFMRQRATLGGALCTTAEAGCLPAATLGTGATLHTNARQISSSEWFSPGTGASPLARGEILTRITLSLPRAATHQFLRLNPGGFSLITVFATIGPQDIRVGVSGLGAGSFRSFAAESWLADGCIDNGAALARVFADASPRTDIQASAGYRQAQASRLLQAAALSLAEQIERISL